MSFLSEEWFDSLRARLESQPALPEGTDVRVGQLVTGAPGGERAWTLVLFGGAKPEVVLGSVEGADVVLVESYEAALSLANGERSAGDLLEAGELKIRGDARVLVSVSSTLGLLAGGGGTEGSAS